ncbi:acyltransferase family protein [Capsulimonas corticalis]|nr:acyltransferase [Capsulimonas corticalis]
MSVTAVSLPGQPANFAKQDKIHLGYLDSLRGVAAFYVMLSHLRAEVVLRTDPARLPAHFLSATGWMDYGLVAVMIFIVLSGYCLMIPVTRSSDRQLRGGALTYLRRRARRILPPYYAALLLSLAVIALETKLRQGVVSHWADVSTGDFQPGVLLSHLFLIHNLRTAWAYQINGPLWSVATEWQIYFLFPALLLPLWRRFGVGAAVAAGILLGSIPHFLLHHRLDVACPQFIGLFALGMGAAALSFQREMSEKVVARWGIVAAVVLCASFGGILLHHSWFMEHPVEIDPIIGFGVASFLIFCTQWLRTKSNQPLPPGIRVLQSPLLIALGAMSYSLYLVHYLILGSMHLFLIRAGQTPVTSFAVMAVFGLPLAIAAAYLFHITIERRFMTQH